MNRVTYLGVLAVLAALAACSGRGRVASEALSRTAKTRDAICACTELTCADQAQHDHERWLHANQARLKKSGEGSTAYQEKLTRLLVETKECHDRLVAAAVPALPPPSEPVAEEQPRPAPLEGDPIEEIEPSEPKPPGYKPPTEI